MPQAELEITQDVVEALDNHLHSMLTTPEPVAILAAYLDSLAKSYGLSESGQIDEDPLQRVHLPAPAVELVNHYLADGAALIDADPLRDRLYHVFVELSRDPIARKELNKNTPLTDQGLLHLAQVYWNLEGTARRSALPIRPGKITTRGMAIHADIPSPGANKDFATMPWTARVNEKGSYKSSGQGFRKQGARLAVLAAKHIIDSTSGAPPSLGNADLRRIENETGRSEVSIVWPDKGGPAAGGHRSDAESSPARIPMPAITSRARASFAIDSFEQDLRQSIERFLLGNLSPEEVFGLEYDKLRARQASADVSETVLLTQYLYPQEAYDVLLQHSDALPADLADALRSNLAAFDNLVPVRNRVMHGRPLQPDDLDEAESFIRRVRSQYLPQTDWALGQLASESGWEPRRRTRFEPPDLVLHNLPDADFNETGLLGREQAVNDIVSRLKQRRDRMITLLGEGGIGKTALALEICYRLVDDPEPPFDAILWTSLKNERLTPTGVRELSNAVRDIAGATRALGKEIDRTFQGSTDELAVALGERRTLLVIDNLETAHGIEVEDLYDTLPDTVRFLFTSRVGVGQFERRIPIGPLEEDSAERLFRKFAGKSGQPELAERPATAVRKILHQLRYSPLAIRWYVLSVEVGKPPADSLINQEELLRFCVGNVVDDLSGSEKLLLEVLRRRDDFVSFNELAAVSQMEIDDLRSSALRLQQRSLIVWSQPAGNDETDLLTLSSTARAFLGTVTQPAVAEEAVRLDDAYSQERERERERIADHGRYLDPNVIFERSPNDAPTAHLLQQALRESKSGHPDEAARTLARARALNPSYFEVDRVDAILASFRRETTTADGLFRSSLSNCDTDEQRSWVGYFYASLLARQVHDIPAAIRMAQEAHAFFNSYDTALQLGNFCVWAHRFEEGKELIESALERTPGKPRFERIATTSLVECFRRWSEDSEAGPPEASLDRALHAMHLGLELHYTGSTDEQLMRSILLSAVAALSAVSRMEDLNPDVEVTLANALRRLAEDAGFILLPPWRQLERALCALTVELRGRLAPGFVTLGPPMDASAERVLGSIFSLHDKFGFVSNPNYPSNVFFHAGSVRLPTRFSDLKVGSPVEFTPSTNDKGQDRAMDVVLTEPSFSASSATPG